MDGQREPPLSLLLVCNLNGTSYFQGYNSRVKIKEGQINEHYLSLMIVQEPSKLTLKTFFEKAIKYRQLADGSNFWKLLVFDANGNSGVVV